MICRHGNSRAATPAHSRVRCTTELLIIERSSRSGNLPNLLSNRYGLMARSNPLKFSGEHSRWERQPYFANCSAVEAIIGISRDYPKCRITVHAGHCHSATQAKISSTLEIQVAGAVTGMPALQEILMID